MLTGRDRPDLPDIEHERTFHEAQRSADTIFSHYQLSQVLANHDLPAPMAQAVLDELVHVCDADGGLIWLRRLPGGSEDLVARTGAVEPMSAPSAMVAGHDADVPGWVRVDLEDIGVVALTSTPERPIDAAARRFLLLVRHELAIALRGAVLRETLEGERAELAAIVQGATDAIIVVDPDRRITRLNPAAERMLQRTAASVRGETCATALRCGVAEDPLGGCSGHCPFERVLQTGEPRDGAERIIVASNGEMTSVVGSYAITARSGDGRPRAVGILRDQTELARLTELRRGFLGDVSHELRTPLALIKGYVETLLELDPDPSTARAYLSRIDETTTRLGGIVGQILDATQMAADHVALTVGRVPLEPLLREAAQDLSVGFPRIHVRIHVAEDVPAVSGDHDRLRQVMDNLLTNAAKYGGKDDIHVRAWATEDQAVIRVEDSGIGIPVAERELVFEQYHRGSNVREHNVPGSGLGLAISRRLVTAHGGSIAFDPDREDGSAMEMRLPLWRGSGAAALNGDAP